MLALYKILVLDAQNDSPEMKDIKATLYHFFFVDNGTFSANSELELARVFRLLPEIFGKYKFETQQWESNSTLIPSETNSEKVGLLGMLWDKSSDTLSIATMSLDPEAETKRKI